MSDGFSLIKVDGKIAEPATVLIRKIADGIGGGFRPRQIRRVAQAQADAEVIKAKSNIEISELQQRALTRFIMEESKKQDNIESITEKAIPQLTSSSTPQDMDNDWIMNFFDKCRIISDEDMQILWAKILAGESNSPGTYSKRTVNSMASLDKRDAVLFAKLCGFNWLFGDLETLIYDEEASIYRTAGINFDTLIHLDDIGLISFSTSGFTLANLPKRIKCHYYGEPIIIESKQDEDNSIKIGKVLLSRTEKQLAPICDSKPVDGFTEYILDNWRKQGLTPSSPHSE